MSEIRTKVCIIGGGIAGLKAASDLTSYGIEVVLLEARDRLGGRIFTDRSGLAPYDMGASWFHDTLENPLFNLSRRKSHYLHYNDDEPMILTSSGPVSRNDKLPQVLKEMLRFNESRFFESLDAPDRSLQNMAYEYIHQQRDLLTDTQVRLVPELVRDLELWHGIAWQSMSAKYAIIDHQGRDSYMGSGYDTIIADLEDTIPKRSVKLQEIVTGIERSHAGVRVHTSSGVVQADYVVVTVPQSVLSLAETETGGIKWFPSLPKAITDALSQMSFGSLGKVVLEFSEAFWPSEDKFLCLADPDKATVQKLIPVPWEWPVNFFNMTLIYGVPTLVALLQSPVTNYVEQHPTKAWALLQPMVEQIAQASGSTATPPTKVLVSDWSVNPFSRGSYSAAEPGNDPTDIIVQLSEGLNRVRFAGEHTIGEGAGCVHGAWVSGQREARHILVREGLVEVSDDD
ncbi:hypothetical protein BABINDRAFT_40283 [Babjeviella inositovora NRRL Y-12698]|uniref:Amine oxidase n=1 Tax=Babjeviella inositovora NRRL Y-12698 TaxID=984486 RepID=A0A1E3QJY0_9ASCO|nr:uncharacterized protein BABINDRAFT_40283 [Babjeviella inositovora NRRL Y-12698]ODQ77995.1 hypothetical protein BABINDRAFT_40283 [Babjeviella inositovora NRRL Y-12698]